MFWRRKLQAAYTKDNYVEAQSTLNRMITELEEINPTAANSLKEGISDTLTLHRLGLNRILGRSFSTTNCIESILAQVEQYTERVDHWRNGAHIQRWVAAGLLEVEPRLNKVHGWKHLPLLRDKIKEELQRLRRESESPMEQKLIEVEA